MTNDDISCFLYFSVIPSKKSRCFWLWSASRQEDSEINNGDLAHSRQSFEMLRMAVCCLSTENLRFGVDMEPSAARKAALSASCHFEWRLPARRELSMPPVPCKPTAQQIFCVSGYNGSGCQKLVILLHRRHYT